MKGIRGAARGLSGDVETCANLCMPCISYVQCWRGVGGDGTGSHHGAALVSGIVASRKAWPARMILGWPCGVQVWPFWCR